MEAKLNTIQSLIGVLNSPTAQRKGVTISPEQCKIWVEELSKFMQKSGWRPGSELPPLNKDGNSQDLITICGTMNFHCDLPRWSSVVGGVWGDKDVKWWCYPPEED